MPPARSDRTAKRFAECTLFTAVVIAVFSLLEMMFGQLNPEDLPSVPRSSELLMKSLRERSLERAQESAEEEDEEEEAPPAPSPEEPEAEAQLQALSELALKAEAGDAEKDESKKSLLQVTPEQVNAMRRQLQEWLRQVATFHEVESFSLMTRWLDFNTTDEVNAGLDHALRKDSEAQWVICASENEVCQCNSGHVRYGTFNKGWVTKKNKAQILCTLEKFSKTDMAYGMLKLCQCHDPPDRETGFEALKEIQTDGAARGSEGSEGETEGEKGPPGTLWASVRQVSAWVGKAEVGQLQVLARVYHLLEYTGNKAKVAAAIAKVVRKAVATSRFHCKDVPGRVANMTKCSQTSMVPCRAACSSDLELSKRSWRSELVPREEMCRSSDVEQLWSCEAASSRVPKAGHPHEEAQKVLDLTLKEMCQDAWMSRLWLTYLDCDFLQNYLRWTSPESDWLEEAFVTYVAGPQDSIYALQAVNLIRSIDLFSTRPVVVVVFDDKFMPPAQWHGFPNVIVYKMLPMKGHHVSFNFNKLRAMVAARVLVGIQLDTDQLITPSLERMFAATRREIHEHYPWVMLPVHWMSRDAKPGELYSDMNFQGWHGQRTMRWGHAHPSWSFWALPFLCNLLYERFRAASKPGKIEVWDLKAAELVGLPTVLREGKKLIREAKFGHFMLEDEDMLNVGLWRDLAKKEWCKFDLEWALFKERFEVADKSLSDSKWYPDGVPLAYISMHNTKQFEVTDWLLSWLARCFNFRPVCREKGKGQLPSCQEDSSSERLLRRRPAEYMTKMCCCLEPRMKKWIFWGKTWFSNSADVPGKMPGMQKNRTCSLP